MRIKTILVLILGVSLFFSCKENKTAHTENAAIIYYGGDIITMEGEPGSTVESVVTKNEKIVFVGSLKDAKDKFQNAQMHDLQGKVMMPGFIEQHLHPFLGALTLVMDVIAPEPWELPTKTWEPAYTKEEYRSQLIAIEKSMDNPDEVLLTWGYHGNFHGDMSRSFLDSVSSTRPILVWHRSVHEMYLNTAMLEQLELNEEWLQGFDDQIKQQINLDNGYFFEGGAMIALLPEVYPIMGSEERMRKGLRQMITLLRNNGITAFNEPGAFIMPDHYDIYKEMLGSEETPFYSFFIPESKTPYYQNGIKGPDSLVLAIEDITKRFPEKGKIRFFKKHIKLLIDGAIVSQLMMMEDGYLDGHEGEWIQNPETISKLFDIFWPLDYQIHVHVNGDKGMNELLKVIDRKMKEMPRKDHRTTIVHFANSTDEQVKRLSELGCIISANPYYVTAFSDNYSEIGLGPERASAMVRSGTAEKYNIPYSLHSDLPIGPSDPLYLVWCAVTRESLHGNIHRPDLALSVHGALRGITIEAAYSWRMEESLGSIKKDKIANFTIIDKNPYTVAPDKIKDIEVWGTVFEGQVFPKNKN